MKPPRFVTRDLLIRHCACSEQVALFARTLPGGALLTAANIRRAAEAGLILDWFAEEFLPAAALRAYAEATGTARLNHLEATSPVWQAYRKSATATAAQVDHDNMIVAWQTHLEARAVALRAYRAATAEALITAFGLPETEPATV